MQIRDFQTAYLGLRNRDIENELGILKHYIVIQDEHCERDLNVNWRKDEDNQLRLSKHVKNEGSRQLRLV